MRFHIITSETNKEDNTDMKLTITLMFITALFIVTTTPTRAYHISKSNFYESIFYIIHSEISSDNWDLFDNA